MEKPQTENRRFPPTGRGEPGKTPRLMGTGLGLACQEHEGQLFGRVWNRIEPCV